MPNNNIRSFRYSDEVAGYLESEPGDSVNEKFVNLVVTCHRMIPDVLSRKESLEADVKELREKRDALRQQIYSLEDVKVQKAQVLRAINGYCEELLVLKKRAAEVLEGPLL